jgi:hypothetical protein
MRTVGGFPPDLLKEDDTGLFGVGEINLNIQQGRELFALVEQRVITDFSVGWSLSAEDMIIEDGIRKISKSGLWEASLVDEPMNPNAMLTTFKGAVSVEKLPNKLAARELRWDSAAAEMRWREQTGSSDEPSDAYRNGFLWFDSSEADEFGAYKLQVVDIVDGEAVVVPRAVFAARAVLEGARGGVDLPDEDRPKVENSVDTLYERMGLDPPFSADNKGLIYEPEIRGLPDGLLVDRLRKGRLSKGAADMVLGLRNVGHVAGPEANTIDADIRTALKELQRQIKGV